MRPAGHASSDRTAWLTGKLIDKVYQGTTVLAAVQVEGVGKVSAERPVAEVSDLAMGADVELDVQKAHAVSRRKSS